MSTIDRGDPQHPSDDQARQASDVAKLLAAQLSEEGLPFTIQHDGHDVAVKLPPAVGQLVVDLLSYIGRGDMVTIMPQHAVLTTKEAADYLNVSRPFLVRLLEKKEIPFHKVGSHRRVSFRDLAAYRKKRDRVRSEALDELQALGQEFDAG